MLKSVINCGNRHHCIPMNLDVPSSHNVSDHWRNMWPHLSEWFQLSPESILMSVIHFLLPEAMLHMKYVLQDLSLHMKCVLSRIHPAIRKEVSVHGLIWPLKLHQCYRYLLEENPMVYPISSLWPLPTSKHDDAHYFYWGPTCHRKLWWWSLYMTVADL